MACALPINALLLPSFFGTTLFTFACARDTTLNNNVISWTVASSLTLELSAARIIQDAVKTKLDLIKTLISQVGLFNRDDNGRDAHDECFPSFSQVGYDMSLQIYLSSNSSFCYISSALAVTIHTMNIQERIKRIELTK